MPFYQITLKAEKPPDPVYLRIHRGLGGHIRKRRIEEKMSGEELAKLFGVNLNTAYKWERGVTIPPMRYMELITHFLGYDPGWEVTRLCGAEIVCYRLHRGVSQGVFAREFGVSVCALRHWERNQSRPSLKVFEKLRLLLASTESTSKTHG